MSTQDIVQKLWNLCNVLRDDGITYHQYVTELTYILFLKMADETGADKDIPEAYRWGSLTSRSGIDLKKHYYTLLSKLGEESIGRVAQIYANASSSIEEPKNLEKIINLLPGMKSPTVLPLAESGWLSIHSVIKEDKFWDVIENLKKEGAQGILVLEIEKMIL